MDHIQGMVIFAKVVEVGSFSGAAQQLGLAKSSVSKHIAKLEAKLGVRLIQRSTRQLRVTEEGLLIYQRCRRIVQEIEQSQQDASFFHQQPQGTLRITAPPLFGSSMLAGLLPKFQQLHADLKVDLFLTENYSEVIAEGFDVSIRLGSLPDSGLVAQVLTHIDLAVVAAPAYLRQHGNPQNLSQLQQHRCLLWQPQGKGVKDNWAFTRQQQQQNVVVANGFCSNDWHAIKQACLAGAGICRISAHAVADEVARGDLVLLLPEYQTPKVAVTVLYPQRKQIPAKTSVFIAYIREEFALRRHQSSAKV